MKIPKQTPTISVLSIPLILLLTIGCSKEVKLASVVGRVTYTDQPLSDGVKILFSNTTAGVFITAQLDSDGRYKVEMAEGYGLPPGTYQVALLPPLLTPSSEMVEKYRADPKGPPPELMAFPKIPIRYRKPETSGLSLVLTEKGATFDVDMTP